MFLCGDCGAEYAKWEGKCRSCGGWNTLKEWNEAKPAKKGAGPRKKGAATPMPARSVSALEEERLSCGLEELDHLFGGGIPKGAVYLIAGEPGVGKSTFLLLLASKLAPRKVLYVSGEETPAQIRQRIDRLKTVDASLDLVAETDIERVAPLIESGEWPLVMIDSIQTMREAGVDAAAGSPGQLRQLAHRLMTLAKTSGTALLVTGHITKSGDVAGPKLLEHLVDGTFLMETEPGGGLTELRVFRPLKNRFGPTDTAGVFILGADGLQPSEKRIFGGTFDGPPVAGAVHHPHFLGKRIFFSSIEALAVPGGMPPLRRVAEGVPPNRMLRLVAILEKYAEIPLSAWDLYLHVGGGIRDEDPFMDLALLASLYAGVRSLALPRRLLLIGEAGLSGQIKAPPDLESRIREIRTHGPFRIAGRGETDHPIRHVADLIALLQSLARAPEAG